MEPEVETSLTAVVDRIERAKFVVGKRLLDRRKAVNLSQAKLERRSGVSRRCIQNLEAGVVCPDLYTLFRLGHSLSVPPSDFIEGL